MQQMNLPTHPPHEDILQISGSSALFFGVTSVFSLGTTEPVGKRIEEMNYTSKNQDTDGYNTLTLVHRQSIGVVWCGVVWCGVDA